MVKISVFYIKIGVLMAFCLFFIAKNYENRSFKGFLFVASFPFQAV